MNLVSEPTLCLPLPLKKLITLALCFLSVVSNHIKKLDAQYYSGAKTPGIIHI